ncbi:MAG: RdgB/HAM1 family non-canonical purine NTP pyrophosphatase, partial [Candidatus Aminicenantia bacterium]
VFYFIILLMRIKKLVVASFNDGKVREIKKILGDIPFDVISLKEGGFEGNYEEKGRSFIEIARGKAVYWSRITKVLTLGEDSGLEVSALGGAPGIFSARFAGEEKDSDKNIEKLLKELEGYPAEKRRAFFKCAVSISFDGNVIFETVDKVEGIILSERRGKGGFGYDPVFFYPPLGKSFAEISVEEKNLLSHRGKAFRKVKDFLLKWNDKSVFSGF